MKNLVKNKQSLLLIGIIILAIIILASMLLFKKPATPPSNSSQNPIVNLQLENVQPAKNAPLEIGKAAQFAFSFNQPIELNQFNIKVTKINITQDNSSTIADFVKQFSNDKKTLILSLKEPVGAYTSYTITLSSAETGTTLYTASYFSQTPKASPATSNNLQLKQFLPYETNNFVLSYVVDTNTYVFNFKFDINNPATSSTQFDQAKQQALDFIKSKDIDPNSVVIDWRHS